MIKEYIQDNRQRFLDELFELLRIPSVSAVASHKPDMEKCAEKYGFTREAQDAFATESVKRAQAAIASGAFAAEIVSVKVAGKKGDVEYATDEQPGKSDVTKIPTLKPAFGKQGGNNK